MTQLYGVIGFGGGVTEARHNSRSRQHFAARSFYVFVAADV